MNFRRTVAACTVSTLALSLLGANAVSQQQPLKAQLVGTWILVSWEQKKSDGTKVQRYGANPTGIAFFDAGGRYVITVMRSDRAKYASNALWQGTAEEDKATADGTITYFGTYSVSEPDSSIAIHIEGSSFPNWNGADQKRIVAISGDELTLTVRPPNGEIVDVIWTRAKWDWRCEGNQQWARVIVDSLHIHLVVEFSLARKYARLQMQEISLVRFSGVFSLRDGVSEKEFLPRLHAFFQHFIDMGFATRYRVMRREALAVC